MRPFQVTEANLPPGRAQQPPRGAPGVLTHLTVPALEAIQAEAEVGLQLVLAGAPVLTGPGGALVPVCGQVRVRMPREGLAGRSIMTLLLLILKIIPSEIQQ